MKRDLRECGRRSIALFLVCLILSPVTLAATFGELYTVSVEPDQESRDQRADAIRRGMSLLLTRITGRQQAAAYPEMAPLIRNARDYLAVYDLLPANEVRVGFNGFEIEQALQRLNMPIWGEERPATLLWLAMDFGDGQRAELQADPQSPPLRAGAVAGVASEPLSDDAAEIFEGIVDEILTAADERGLPLVLPLLDAEDRRHVRFADVWGGFDQFVARAAERYAVDAVLMARVVPTELGLEVNWTVQRGDRRETLTTPRARLGIDWLADEFASELATVGGAQVTFITVRGVQSWARDYSVIEYLERVSIVERVDIDSISGDQYVLRVAARGDNSQLERILALDGVLAPVEDAPGLVFVPAARRLAGEAPATP